MNMYCIVTKSCFRDFAVYCICSTYHYYYDVKGTSKMPYVLQISDRYNFGGVLFGEFNDFSPFFSIKLTIFIHCVHAQWNVHQIEFHQAIRISILPNFDTTKTPLYSSTAVRIHVHIVLLQQCFSLYT